MDDLDQKNNNKNNTTKEEKKALKDASKRMMTIPDEDAHHLPFTAIPNEILEHPDITPLGKLLMVYLLKHAAIPDWVYLDCEMQKFLGCGRDKLEFSFRSLRKAGYSTLTILRDSNGHICGSRRIFARTAKFLDRNRNRLTLVPKTLAPAGLHRDPENQGTGDQGPGNQGTLQRKIFKNKNYKNNNNKGGDSCESKLTTNHGQQDVVVSLMDEIKIWAITEVMLRGWLKKHSIDYIREKILYTKTYATKNPAGLLRKAIEGDYKIPPLPKHHKPKTAVTYASHRENMKWYQALAEKEKIRLYKAAVHKAPTFENYLEYNKISALDASFVTTTWFGMMMQIIERAG